MYNHHMIYQMNFINNNPAFVVPLIKISDGTYLRFVYKVPRYVDIFGTPSLSSMIECHCDLVSVSTSTEISNASWKYSEITLTKKQR